MNFKTRGSANPRAKWGKDVPDTPSPKKNRVGGSDNLRYGRIAWDLSCPNPLRNRNRNENPSQKLPDRPNNKGKCGIGIARVFARVSSPPGLSFDYSPRWVSELDLPFSVGEDGYIIGDYFDFVRSFISNEVREHCADKRGHSTRAV